MDILKPKVASKLSSVFDDHNSRNHSSTRHTKKRHKRSRSIDDFVTDDGQMYRKKHRRREDDWDVRREQRKHERNRSRDRLRDRDRDRVRDRDQDRGGRARGWDRQYEKFQGSRFARQQMHPKTFGLSSTVTSVSTNKPANSYYNSSRDYQYRNTNKDRDTNYRFRDGSERDFFKGRDFYLSPVATASRTDVVYRDSYKSNKRSYQRVGTSDENNGSDFDMNENDDHYLREKPAKKSKKRHRDAPSSSKRSSKKKSKHASKKNESPKETLSVLLPVSSSSPSPASSVSNKSSLQPSKSRSRSRSKSKSKSQSTSRSSSDSHSSSSSTSSSSSSSSSSTPCSSDPPKSNDSICSPKKILLDSPLQLEKNPCASRNNEQSESAIDSGNEKGVASDEEEDNVLSNSGNAVNANNSSISTKSCEISKVGTEDSVEATESLNTVSASSETIETDSVSQSATVTPILKLYYPSYQGCRSVESFALKHRIAEGTYGVVFKAQDKLTKEIVALKRLKMENEKEGFPITSLREVNTILKANHPNVVNVREIVVGSNMNQIFIVMDYVEHDMKTLMETMRKRNQVFLQAEVKCLLQQLLSAIAHLHDHWILHRDLKTSNLLFSNRGVLKVGDFGLAREYGSPLIPYTSVVVTLWYRAPELLLGIKEYSCAIDVWSIGCIFAEFLTMNPLFPGKTDIDQINLIFKNLGTPNEKIWPGYNRLPAIEKFTFIENPKAIIRDRIGSITTGLGLDLLLKLLTYNPNQRITAESALSHSYFAEQPLPIDAKLFPSWPSKQDLPNSKSSVNVSVPKPVPSSSEPLIPVVAADNSSGGFRMQTSNHPIGQRDTSFSLKF